MDLPDEFDRLDLDNDMDLNEDILFNMLDELQAEEKQVELPIETQDSFVSTVKYLFHHTQWGNIKPLNPDRPSACFQCFKLNCSHVSIIEDRPNIDQMLDNILSEECTHNPENRVIRDICTDCLAETFRKTPINKQEKVMILWDESDLICYTNWIQDIDKMSYISN